MTASDAPPAALYAAHVAAMQAHLARALEATGFDGLVILAGDLLTPPRDDVPYAFRVEPHFAAWLPLAASGAALVLAPGARPILLYPRHDDFWHAPAGDPAGFWVEHFDIRVLDTGAAKARELRTLGAGFALVGAGAADDGAFAARNDPRLLARLAHTRAVKTDYEAACMRRANDVAVRGHARLGEAFEAGLGELELAALYLAATGQRETELPYGSIVAQNEHAAILHYERLDRAPPDSVRTLLVDAGASARGYAADVTRTWTPAGSPLAPLVADVSAMQQALCAEVRAGVDFVALNERAHELLAEVLVRHALVRCGAAEAHGAGLTRAFLPHGLGHLLGLQVHDAGGRQIDPDGGLRAPPEEHPFLRLTRVLEPGFVVTIEPGLYFIPGLLGKLAPADRARVNWGTVEALLPYGGIRIEDDVLVTADGHLNLTRAAFAACGGA